MKITIPFKTPTINHLYWHRGNIKIMTTEAKKIKAEITKIIDDMLLTDKYIPHGALLKVIVLIYEDWNCKNGEVKRKDISNREKFMTDSIFDALGIDDKFIFEHTMKKIQSTEEKAIITIEEIKDVSYN
jgi:Holliday junction resolvase RusA-like endonuclease